MTHPPGPRLRIIAGEFGGRRLVSPRGDAIRPSAERTREAIFSMLGPLQGEAVLDLYCGTGSLGLEALSRGAGRLRLVDTTIAAAAENVALLDVGERCELLEKDSLAFLRSSREAFDLVLCDPPYKLADRLGPELDKLLVDRLRTGARVVVECPADRPLELALPLQRERRHGAALIRIYSAPGES